MHALVECCVTVTCDLCKNKNHLVSCSKMFGVTTAWQVNWARKKSQQAVCCGRQSIVANLYKYTKTENRGSDVCGWLTESKEQQCSVVCQCTHGCCKPGSWSHTSHGIWCGNTKNFNMKHADFS